MGRTFAIGDIHGRLDKLSRLLNRIGADPATDTLVFMGDYIDRGPDSAGVVQKLIDISAIFQNTVFLKGNHEAMFESFRNNVFPELFLVNGGKETLKDYKNRFGSEEPPEQHLAFFDSLLLYHETDTHIFVHAGLSPGIPLPDQTPDDLLWIRTAFIESDADFGKTVVFGHTPFREPMVRGNKIGIDTGAVYGNRLTCLCLPEETFLQV